MKRAFELFDQLQNWQLSSAEETAALRKIVGELRVELAPLLMVGTVFSAIGALAEAEAEKQAGAFSGLAKRPKKQSKKRPRR